MNKNLHSIFLFLLASHNIVSILHYVLYFLEAWIYDTMCVSLI